MRFITNGAMKADRERNQRLQDDPAYRRRYWDVTRKENIRTTNDRWDNAIVQIEAVCSDPDKLTSVKAYIEQERVKELAEIEEWYQRITS